MRERQETLNAVRRKVSARLSVVIWTTTPWTIPGNRAIGYSTESPTGSMR